MSRTPETSDIHRADRIAIRAILVIGFIGGVIATLMGLFTAVTRVLDPARYPVQLLADVPVPAGGGIVQAHGDSVLVNADGLSAGAVWLLAGGDLVSAVTIGIVTLACCSVLWNVVQRRPFHRSMQLAALAAGFAIALGSLLSQGLSGLGRLMAATELSSALGGVTEPGFLFTPLPVLAGFGILALVYVFRAGARLQRDTEGLV